MQMLKKLRPGWEPRPPRKLRCSACIIRGHHAEVCLEIRWKTKGKVWPRIYLLLSELWSQQSFTQWQSLWYHGLKTSQDYTLTP